MIKRILLFTFCTASIYILTCIGLSLALSIQPRISQKLQKERFVITTYFDYFNCYSLDHLNSINIQPITSRNEFECQTTQCYTLGHWDSSVNYKCVNSELSDLFMNYSMPLAITYKFKSNGQACKEDELVEINAYPAEECIYRKSEVLSYECKDGFFVENHYNASSPTNDPCQTNNVIKQTKIPINTCTADGYIYNCNQK